MKRLLIVAEGQTEQEFIIRVFRPYMASQGVYNVIPILIRTSKKGRGGLFNYTHLRDTVKGLLSEPRNKTSIVTTLIDFFRIPCNMPGYHDAMSLKNDEARVDALQKALGEDINDRRFIPYIQLHEFEALLFSDNAGFEAYYDEEISHATQDIINEYENPEDINSGPETAPSKRLMALIPDYRKVLEGNLIALEVGINSMLEKCPRFAAWVEKLVRICRN